MNTLNTLRAGFEWSRERWFCRHREIHVPPYPNGGGPATEIYCKGCNASWVYRRGAWVRFYRVGDDGPIT